MSNKDTIIWPVTETTCDEEEDAQGLDGIDLGIIDGAFNATPVSINVGGITGYSGYDVAKTAGMFINHHKMQ